MSNRALDAVKYALVGSVAGSAVAYAGDVAWGFIGQAIGGMAAPGPSAIDQLGRAALTGLAAASTAAVVLYAGEQLMQRAGANEDPLVGLFYYQVGFNTMKTAYVAPSAVRNILAQLFTSVSGVNKPGSRVPAPMADSAREASMYQTGNCPGKRCGNMTF